MATPGRKRGRPPKPKAETPEKDRGRPPEPLSSHKYRFQIAAFKVAERWLGLGSRTVSKGLVASAFDAPARRFPASGSSRERFARGDVSLQAWWDKVVPPFDLDPPDPAHPELAMLRVPLSPKQFNQHADLVRKLASRFPKTEADAAWWLDAICQAIVIAKTIGPYRSGRQTAKAGALFFAGAVGEELWARERLLPLIDSLPTPADRKADLDSITRIIADLLSQPL
jgi:hypothetical protein